MGSRGSSSGRKNANTGIGKPNDATEYYVSGDGMWINSYLRNPNQFEANYGELSENEKKIISDMDKATSGKITDEVLYRNVDAAVIFGNMSENDLYNLTQTVVNGADSWGKGAYADGIRAKAKEAISKVEGKTVTEKGFMSTTASRSVAENWGSFTGSENPIVMRINPNKKAKGVNVSEYDKNAYGDPQNERILARNQSYKIKKVYSKNNLVYVDVDIV